MLIYLHTPPMNNKIGTAMNPPNYHVFHELLKDFHQNAFPRRSARSQGLLDKMIQVSRELNVTLGHGYNVGEFLITALLCHPEESVEKSEIKALQQRWQQILKDMQDFQNQLQNLSSKATSPNV